MKTLHFGTFDKSFVLRTFKKNQNYLIFHTAHLAEFCMLWQDDLEEVQPPPFSQDQSHQFLLQCHTVLSLFSSFSLPSTAERWHILEGWTWNVQSHTPQGKKRDVLNLEYLFNIWVIIWFKQYCIHFHYHFFSLLLQLKLDCSSFATLYLI